MVFKKFQNKLYRPELDGLRAIAISAVIINHFDNALLPSGHLGVDIFFVISGFVITQSLTSRQYISFWTFIVDFYHRRMKRLAPALLFFIGITILLTLFVIDPQSPLSSSSINTGIAALFGTSNILLFWMATDYFSSSADLNPFTHTWSLGVEEQFYLLFPLIIWFSGYLRSRRTGIFICIISVSGILSFFSYYWFMKNNPVAGFYLIPARFWELAIGSLSYCWTINNGKIFNNFNKSFLHVCSAITLFFLIATLALPNIFPRIATTAVVCLAAILIVNLRLGFVTHKLLTIRPIIFLGVISYSLYLWHWGILTISRWTIGIHWWSIPIQIVVILIFSIFSYFYIEQPFRNQRWPIIKNNYVSISPLIYSSFLLICCSIFIFNGANLLKDHLYTGEKVSLVKKVRLV